jgi:hypothetical protein
MKRFIAVAILALGGLSLPGCVVTARPVAWVAVEGHVHGEACGHYYYHGGWYVMTGHRHGPSCGHVYMGGMWVHDDGGSLHGNTVVVAVGHVHSESCGHFFYNGGWYLSAGHRHGPGCGHVMVGGH